MMPPFKINERSFAYYDSLRRLKAIVDSVGTDGLTLRRAAEIAGMESTYFSSFFRKKVGICFRDWRQLCRIKISFELMHDRDYSITQIAFEAGFGDISSFQRAFKRITGMSPRDFIKQTRPENND